MPKLTQKLDSLNAAKTLEPIEPVVETDIEVCPSLFVLSVARTLFHCHSNRDFFATNMRTL